MIGDLHGAHERDEMTIHEVAGKLAARLRHSYPDPDWDLLDVIEEFEAFAADGDGDALDYDCILEQLYDWADANRLWLDPAQKVGPIERAVKRALDSKGDS